MNNKDSPAMPFTTQEWFADVKEEKLRELIEGTCGLTKREHFAGLAMQGLLANSGGVIQSNHMSGTGWCNGDAKSMAELSVDCADALLAELSK